MLTISTFYPPQQLTMHGSAVTVIMPGSNDYDDAGAEHHEHRERCRKNSLFFLIKCYSWCPKFDNLIGWMLVVLFYSRNAKVEISSIPVSPNACDATLAPLSYCEPGLTLCKGCSFCGALVLVYDRQSLTVYSLVHGLCPPHFAKMHNTFGQSFILLCNAVITLCTYAQQGYAFWLHRFICMYI